MNYAFTIPDFVPGLYFCNHKGKGFRLSNQLTDVIITNDPVTVKKVAEQLEQQSGFRVQIEQISVIA